MSRVVGRLAAAGVVVGSLLLAPSASASCAEDAGPAGSDVIFAGTVLEERLGLTRFDVDRVLAGPDLAPEVWVQTGQRQSPWPDAVQVSSSVDAVLDVGSAHVVGADRSFRTDSCSLLDGVLGADMARATEVDLEAARAPTEDGARGAEEPFVSLGQALASGGLGAGLGFVRSATVPPYLLGP